MTREDAIILIRDAWNQPPADPADQHDFALADRIVVALTALDLLWIDSAGEPRVLTRENPTGRRTELLQHARTEIAAAFKRDGRETLQPHEPPTPTALGTD